MKSALDRWSLLWSHAHNPTAASARIDCDGTIGTIRSTNSSGDRSMADTITAPAPQAPNPEMRATGTLDIKDSRTGKGYAVQISEGGVEGDTAIRAMDLRQIKTA